MNLENKPREENESNITKAYDLMRELWIHYDHGGHSGRSRRARLLEGVLFGSKHRKLENKLSLSFDMNVHDRIMASPDGDRQHELFKQLEYLPEEVIAAITVKLITKINEKNEQETGDEFATNMLEKSILESIAKLLNSDFYIEELKAVVDIDDPKTIDIMEREIERRADLRNEQEDKKKEQGLRE